MIIDADRHSTNRHLRASPRLWVQPLHTLTMPKKVGLNTVLIIMNAFT